MTIKKFQQYYCEIRLDAGHSSGLAMKYGI